MGEEFMAIYITSDLHGDMKKFKKLLKRIQFDSQVDHMYILGDVLDRGSHGIELLDMIRGFINQKSMTLIKGNHELFVQMYMENNLDKELWKSWGANNTSEKIDRMTDSEREELLCFFKGLPHYCVIPFSNDREAVLTHSGIHADYIVRNEKGIDILDSIKKAIKSDEFEYLISNDLFYVPQTIIKQLDQYLIVGHVPVIFTREDHSYEIIVNDKYMCVDSGAGYPEMGGKMCAYQVENGKVVYV